MHTAHTMFLSVVRSCTRGGGLALGLLVATIGAGCSEKEPSPLPTAKTPDPGDAGQDSADAAAPTRIVTTRNPFGATEIRGNLLADGDFEFTGRQEQMPWLSFASKGQATLNFETGGKCRSGIRCAVIKQDESVVGWVASPKNGQVSLAIAIKPSTGICKNVVVRFLNLDSDFNATTLKAPAAPEPDGFCNFRGVGPAIPDANPVLYINISSNADTKIVNSAILDNGIVLATAAQIANAPDGTPPTLAPAVSTSFEPLDPSTLTEVRFIRAWIKAHKSFGIPKAPPLENVKRVRE